MNPIIIGNGTALPSLGNRIDSLADGQTGRRSRAAAAVAFPPDDQAAPARATAPQARFAGASAGTGEQPFLRRRTDRGEAADSAIQIPPHLERRRAWREAFGLNTFHTQEIAQREANLPSRQLRSTAAHAYRGPAGRGRLDLDLAQLVSMAV